MRVGIVSDTHGDAAAWQGLLQGVFRGVDLIVHAGDILFQGPGKRSRYGPGELAALINTGPCPVLFARGNCDNEEDQLLLDYPILSPYLFLQAEGLRVLASHGQDPGRKGLLAMARRFGVHLAVYGHTHLPRLEEEDGVVLLNPGSPALPKGGFPSAALLEGDVVRVYDLRDSRQAAELKVKNGR